MSGQVATLINLRIEDIIVSDEHNARTDFSDPALFELGESMKQNTQLNPIQVNCVDDCYYLIAGERRLRAAKAAGNKFIECKVYRDLDALSVMRMADAENLHRVSLNVIEQATSMQRRVDAGDSVERIAKDYGVTDDTIYRRLKLLKLNPDVQRLITREKFPLPTHQALLLLELTESEQIDMARRTAPLTGPVASEAQVRQWIDELKGKHLPFNADDDDDQYGSKTQTPPKSPSDDSPPPSDKPKNLKDDPKPKTKSNDTETVKPIEGKIGISGKIGLTAANVVIAKATLALNLDGKVKTVSIGEMTLDLPDESFKELSKAIKAAVKKDGAPAAGKSNTKKNSKK